MIFSFHMVYTYAKVSEQWGARVYGVAGAQGLHVEVSACAEGGAC